MQEIEEGESRKEALPIIALLMFLSFIALGWGLVEGKLESAFILAVIIWAVCGVVAAHLRFWRGP